MSTGRAFERAWRKRFEGFAAHSDDEAGIAGWSRSGLQARVRRFVSLWRAPPPGQRWLDAGCGAGTYTRLLEKDGLEVIGVDYSLVTLRKASALDAHSPRYAAADVRRLPFASGTFDGLLCFGVLQAMADSASVLDELCRQLRPGGQLWLDALNRQCIVHSADLMRRHLRGRPIHLRYESPAGLRRMLLRAGMRDVRVHWMPILPTALQRWQPLLESEAGTAVLRLVPLLGLLSSHAFIVQARKP
jgi:ubiquinone/menaquinone biosynthesis C-methylase UbiE